MYFWSMLYSSGYGGIAVTFKKTKQTQTCKKCYAFKKKKEKKKD